MLSDLLDKPDFRPPTVARHIRAARGDTSAPQSNCLLPPARLYWRSIAVIFEAVPAALPDTIEATTGDAGCTCKGLRSNVFTVVRALFNSPVRESRSVDPGGWSGIGHRPGSPWISPDDLPFPSPFVATSSVSATRLRDAEPENAPAAPLRTSFAKSKFTDSGSHQGPNPAGPSARTR